MPAIANTRLRVDIDHTTGCLRGITDLKFNDEIVQYPAANSHAPVHIVCLDGRGERVELVPASVTSIASGESVITVRHAACRHVVPGEGHDVDIACIWSVSAADDESGASVWSLEVHNSTEDLQVIEVVFPVLRGIAAGTNPGREVLVFPHHAGERIENPAATLASRRYAEFWRGATKLESDGVYAREMNYCGLASMMWMDLYSSEPHTRGIYLGSHDSSFVLTGVRCETGGPERPWMGFAFRKHVPVRPGETWTSSPYSVALHDGDWRWGAAHYRSWISHHISLPTDSHPLAYDAALVPRYDLKNNGVVLHRYNEIPQMFDEARSDGIDHLFISAWNRSGFDTDYPEYVPDMELGSSWELAEGCDYVCRQGGRCSFYINVRLFDLESDYYERLGRNWALKDFRGDVYRETYGQRSFAVLCPGNRDWIKWVADTAGWMSKAFRAAGIYLDQLGSAEPFPCYDLSHDHRLDGGHHHGLYNHGYLDMIRKVRDRVNAVDPSSFLMIENCGDIYSQHLYANLTWNGAPYDEFFNMYKYTFPEFIQINMVNPRRIDDRCERHAWFYSDLARAFVLGSVFWAELGDRFGAGDDSLLEAFRIALRLRQQAAPLIARSMYRDIDGLEFIDAQEFDSTHAVLPGYEGECNNIDWNELPYRGLRHITASRWTLQRHGVLVLMSNPQRLKGQRIRIHCLHEQNKWSSCDRMTCVGHDLGGVSLDSDIEVDSDGYVDIEIPESALSFVTLMPEEQR